MCAILDADVVHEVFATDSHEAGKRFFDWINTGRGRLVIGGKLTIELSRASIKFRQWAKIAGIKGRVRTVQDIEVNQRVEELAQVSSFYSNDIHIIALAQISGARLLYSKDGALHKDFTNKELIDQPRGKVYSTSRGGEFSKNHQRLLEDRGLCGGKS